MERSGQVYHVRRWRSSAKRCRVRLPEDNGRGERSYSLGEGRCTVDRQFGCSSFS
ncbi:hypothetical protein LINPERHAP1_LOCUS34881 [Linum perenne]